MTDGEQVLELVKDSIASTLASEQTHLSEANRLDAPADCDCGNDHSIPEGSLLGDWIVVVQFVHPDGDSGYYTISSHGISPHARVGLARELCRRVDA